MRIIVHVDMDAFFAACEERYNPQFRGKSIVVGADPKGGRGRGVVATASYPARKYGIKSAMPISTAWRLAEEARIRGEPETIFLGGNHRLYAEVSERIMAILEKYADAFEEASIDEAYLEWKFQNPNSKLQINTKSGNSKSHSDPWIAAEERARQIKQEILGQEGLTCSVGIGPNKLVAKIASDFKKPDGFTIVRPEAVESFLAPLPIRALPGIGPKTEVFLHQKGIRTIGELQKADSAELEKWFGKWGSDIARHARGISESEVSNEWEPKSVGEQETFAEDSSSAAFILERMESLVSTVFRRLTKNGFQAFRTVVVTVRFADFTTTSRSHTSRRPLATKESLHGEALRLLLPFLDRRENPKRKKIRLIGIRVEKLSR